MHVAAETISELEIACVDNVGSMQQMSVKGHTITW